MSDVDKRRDPSLLLSFSSVAKLSSSRDRGTTSTSSETDLEMTSLTVTSTSWAPRIDSLAWPCRHDLGRVWPRRSPAVEEIDCRVRQAEIFHRNRNRNGYGKNPVDMGVGIEVHGFLVPVRVHIGFLFCVNCGFLCRVMIGFLLCVHIGWLFCVKSGFLYRVNSGFHLWERWKSGWISNSWWAIKSLWGKRNPPKKWRHFKMAERSGSYEANIVQIDFWSLYFH